MRLGQATTISKNICNRSLSVCTVGIILEYYFKIIFVFRKTFRRNVLSFCGFNFSDGVYKNIMLFM